MIIPKEQISIQSSGNLKVSEAKIVASAHIMRVLRDGIYTDKILACIREPIMNAIDSHEEAGQEKEIEVVLPTYINPVFIVRDFGIGLDDYGVREILFSYGDPTGTNVKETSNKYLGSFHIGAKSPWSYTPSFQVVAVKNGVKRTYNAYINEREIGDIALINEETTDLCNGVEISIPVHLSDIDAFRFKLLALLRFNTAKIKVLGNYESIKNEWLIKTDSWGVLKGRKHEHSSYVVMGGVPYTLLAGQIKNASSFGHNLLQYGLVIFANIGDITINASRESVSYTDKTNSFINQILNQIEDDIPKIIAKSFVDCKTLYEVYNQYFSLFSSEGRLGLVTANLYSHQKPKIEVVINDNKYTIDGWEINHDSIFKILTLHKLTFSGFRIKTYTSYKADFFLYKSNYYAIGCDLKERALKRKVLADIRSRHPQSSDKYPVQLIFFKSTEDKDRFFSHFGIPATVEFIDATLLKNPVRLSGTSVSRGPIEAKQVELTDLGFRTTPSNIDLNTIDGYYIRRRGGLFFLKEDSLAEINHYLSAISAFLRKISPLDRPLYSLTEGQIKKLDKSKWKPLSDFLSIEYAKFRKKNSKLVHISRCDYTNIVSYNKDNGFLSKNHPISRLADLYFYDQGDLKYFLIENIFPHPQLDKINEEKRQELLKIIKEKYLFLPQIESIIDSAESAREAADYIKFVDARIKRKKKKTEEQIKVKIDLTVS